MSTQTHDPSTAPPPAPPPPSPGPSAQRGAPVGTVVLGLVLVAAGVLWLLAALGIDLPVEVVTPVALVTVGVAVLVSAFRGEEGVAIGVSIVVGVLLAVAATMTLLVDAPLTGAVGDNVVSPTTVEELDDTYRLFAGSHRIDLRDLEFTDDTVELEVSAVLGEVEVIVPDVGVRIDAGVTAGAIEIFGTRTEGVNLDEQSETWAWDAAQRRLDLHLRVGAGEIRVVRE